MSLSKEVFLRQSDNLKLSIYGTQKLLHLEGACGSILYPLYTEFVYSKKKKKLWLKNSSKSNQKEAFLKMYHILLAQAALGVLVGYRRQLNIVGIGYQVSLEKKEADSFMIFKLGYSHQVSIKVPSYVTVSCPKPRILQLRGINLQKLNNLAAVIRRLKLPSAYKEKGIYYAGEPFSLKQGKKS